MTFWQYLMLAVAVLCLVGPLWNWTVARPQLPWTATTVVLGLAYFAGQGLYLLDPTQPVSEMIDEMFMIDTAAIGLIFCRAIARCPEQDLSSFRRHLRCMATAPTPWDRFVLLIFPLTMWPAYVLTIDEFQRWWVLYIAAMAQFIAAGCEALIDWRKANASDSDPDTPSSGLMFAVARAGRWST